MKISTDQRGALVAVAIAAATALSITGAQAASTAKQENQAAAATADDEPDSIWELWQAARARRAAAAGTTATATETETRPAATVTDAPRTQRRHRAAEAAPRGAAKPAATAERPASRTDLRALVRSHAEAAGVPADLAEAVVKVESNFNPRARGSHGEVGLMQIKPSTARAIGYRGTTAALYDPDTNLAWGMRYLARAYALADGDTCGAILRYNGGHAARKMTRQASAYCGRVKTYVAAL